MPDSLSEFPADLAAVLGTLKARMDPDTLQEITCRLCAWQPLSAEQLAALLKRNRKYVQDRLLTPLLRERRLAPTLPHQPKHPRQAYRTPGNGGDA